MKNYAMPAAIATVGLGLLSIGFNLNGNQANATPAAFNAGLGERTIVWYDSHASIGDCSPTYALLRAWSDGTIERKIVKVAEGTGFSCGGAANCNTPVRDGSDCASTQGWVVINEPSDGMRLAGDLDGNGEVSGSDLGILLNEFGLTEPGTFPPSDCPLGLIP